MNIVLLILVFVVALAVLVKSSDFFVTASEAVGLFLGLPHFITGVLLVGVGTSLPELVSSIFAVAGGASEIVIGNVLGSNIANICLVLGIGAVLSGEIIIKRDILSTDLPLLLGSALVAFVLIFDGKVSALEGGFLIIFLAFFFWSLIKGEKDEDSHSEKKSPGPKNWILLIVSPAGIYFGAKYLIDSVVQLSEVFHIPNEIIALSAVALGTSLPEIIVTAVAAKRGNPEMAVGNVLGSNIFNTFGVIGIPALIGQLHIPESVSSFSLPVFIGVTLLFIISVLDKRITRFEGWFMLLFYLFFIGKIFHFM